MNGKSLTAEVARSLNDQGANEEVFYILNLISSKALAGYRTFKYEEKQTRSLYARDKWVLDERYPAIADKLRLLGYEVIFEDVPLHSLDISWEQK